jgi:cytochrome c peroxidase
MYCFFRNCSSSLLHSHSPGSNGACMRFKPESHWGGNSGLAHARDRLEIIKKQNPGITYADLYTLSGVVAVEAMGGPKVNWRPGRTDWAGQLM